MNTRTFLFEIGTEEIPARFLQSLVANLTANFSSELTKHKLSFTHIKSFTTPRRLAVLIEQLAAKQADYTIERKGPKIAKAYDAKGNPTAAALGFARSCQTQITELS
ncbi:MAG: glycine--tRNA ligase subunit beta, partial [Pseudomonadota bacterium]